MRLIENALMDVILEKDNVQRFLAMILERNLELIEIIKDLGVDGLIFYDDWGAQDRTFISPAIFRELFKPIYKAIGDKLHEHNMHLFVRVAITMHLWKILLMQALTSCSLTN